MYAGQVWVSQGGISFDDDRKSKVTFRHNLRTICTSPRLLKIDKVRKPGSISVLHKNEKGQPFCDRPFSGKNLLSKTISRLNSFYQSDSPRSDDSPARLYRLGRKPDNINATWKTFGVPTEFMVAPHSNFIQQLLDQIP